MKKHLPLIYNVLALGITWLLWIPALLASASTGLPIPTIDYLIEHRSFQIVNSQHLWVVISFTLAVYGPILAALITSYLAGGRARVAAWFTPALRWKVSPRWYGAAVAMTLAIALVPVLVGWPAGLVKGRADYVWPSIFFILFLFIYQFFTSGLGEELGWRGYLLPTWTEQYGREKAIWFSGMIWALWHFPFTIFYTWQTVAGVEPVAQVITILFSLVGQTMSLIAMVYLYAWLLDKSGSIFLAMVLHMLTNTVMALVSHAITANQIVSLAMAAMPWLVVVAIDRIEKRRKPAIPAGG